MDRAWGDTWHDEHGNRWVRAKVGPNNQGWPEDMLVNFLVPPRTPESSANHHQEIGASLRNDRTLPSPLSAWIDGLASRLPTGSTFDW